MNPDSVIVTKHKQMNNSLIKIKLLKEHPDLDFKVARAGDCASMACQRSLQQN